MDEHALTTYKYEVEQVSGIGDEHRGMIWTLDRRSEQGWRLQTAYKDAADRHVLIFEKQADEG